MTHAHSRRPRKKSNGELFRYARQKVQLETQFRQNPRMLTSTNENLAIAVADH